MSEKMTLEQVSRMLRCASEDMVNPRYRTKFKDSADAIDAHLATLPAFTLSQGFVDRVMEDEIEEPPVMGAGAFDSIKRIAEEMVHACKAYNQGDAEFTHDAVDEWAHRIMCFAGYVVPNSTLPVVVPDAKSCDDYEQDDNGQIDGYCAGHMDGWNACREAMLTQRGNAQDAVALCIGQRVMWEDNLGRSHPAMIVDSNPATYDALLDDDVRANGYVRERFTIDAAMLASGER
jgi:hypothetical protein